MVYDTMFYVYESKESLYKNPRIRYHVNNSKSPPGIMENKSDLSIQEY